MYGQDTFGMSDEELLSLGQLPEGGSSWGGGFGWGQEAGAGLGDALMSGMKYKSLKGKLSGGGVPVMSMADSGSLAGPGFGGGSVPKMSMSDME
jgi:hypothetical protein